MGKYFVLVLAGLGLCGAASADASLTFRTQVQMGTLVSVGVEESEGHLANEAFQAIHEVDSALSTYQETSEVSRLNREGGGKMSDLTRDCLATGLKVARETQGAFDPTIGALTIDAYGFSNGHRHVPSLAQVARARSQVDYKKLRITTNEISMPLGMKLDFGGIGKGFAVDRAVERLTAKGIRHAVVAAAGDIRCLGPCEAAIAHPRDRNKVLAQFTIEAPSVALSTSGTSERRIQHTSIHHLIDPKSGRSAPGLLSLTLLSRSETNATLDALTTALFVMGEVKAKEFLSTKPEIGYVIANARNEVTYNDRFSELVGGLSWPSRAAFKIRKETRRKDT